MKCFTWIFCRNNNNDLNIDQILRFWYNFYDRTEHFNHDLQPTVTENSWTTKMYFPPPLMAQLESTLSRILHSFKCPQFPLETNRDSLNLGSFKCPQCPVAETEPVGQKETIGSFNCRQENGETAVTGLADNLQMLFNFHTREKLLPLITCFLCSFLLVFDIQDQISAALALPGCALLVGCVRSSRGKSGSLFIGVCEGDRDIDKYRERDRKTERNRKTDTERNRKIEIQRHRHRKTEIQRQRQRHKDSQKDRDKNINTKTERRRDRD